ncbi:MAG TPA: right-handed parallel beta-helix repeat-containing protein [Holophagaceae bacterium]
MRERLGKFEIVRLLGKGAMGEVYLGRDVRLGREVALKVVHSGSAFGDEAQARFEREAQAAAALNHPNVVTVYEFGEDEGVHYLVMELVEGEEFETLIRDGKAPKAELLEALAQVCEGLAYAHSRGVIHRDIKPSNVLVARHGGRPHAKLMDFGVAQMGLSSLTQTGTWMGTVNYMAPEYLDTGKASASSDLFAVGVILYEVLTGGRKPFQGDTATAVLNRILLHAPEPLRPQDLSEVPGRMVAVLEKALAKNPANRFADGNALAAAIRGALAASAPEPPAPAATVVHPSGGTQPIKVGRGGQALSLKVALRNARPGAQIVLMPGHYRESVVVDKDVSIQAQGDPAQVVLEGVGGPALTLQASGVALHGFTLRAPAGEPAFLIDGGSAQVEACVLEGAESCADLRSGASVQFRDCRMEGGCVGVRVGGDAHLRIQGGRLSGSSLAGVRVLPGGQAALQDVAFAAGNGVGLHVEARGQAGLEGCTIRGAAAGSVEVAPDGRAQLTRCSLVESRFAGLLALERSHAVLEDCEVSGHACAGVHLLAGANVVLRACRVRENAGFGLAIMNRGLATLDGCTVQANGGAGLLIHHGATVQARNSAFSEGRALGVDCAEGGQGVLDGCDISGNAGVGVQVEPGGSLLLVRCTLKEGRDTGLLLLEDSQVTLEECVVHRNARGGILLAREASDPVLRGANRIEDGFQRLDAGGNPVKVAPLGSR